MPLIKTPSSLSSLPSHQLYSHAWLTFMREWLVPIWDCMYSEHGGYLQESEEFSVSQQQASSLGAFTWVRAQFSALKSAGSSFSFTKWATQFSWTFLHAGNPISSVMWPSPVPFWSRGTESNSSCLSWFSLFWVAGFPQAVSFPYLLVFCYWFAVDYCDRNISIPSIGIPKAAASWRMWQSGSVSGWHINYSDYIFTIVLT